MTPEWMQQTALIGERLEVLIAETRVNRGLSSNVTMLGLAIPETRAQVCELMLHHIETIEQALRVGMQCARYLAEIAEDRRVYVSTRMMSAAMRPPRLADWKAINQLLIENGLLPADTPADVVAADHGVVACEGCKLALPYTDALHTCKENRVA